MIGAASTLGGVTRMTGKLKYTLHPPLLEGRVKNFIKIMKG